MSLVYDWKSIQPVLSVNDLIDAILTRTVRKTPTVIHANFNIIRIRQFYMRKVKFTEQTSCEKLQQIVNEFPRLDDIHPFYADLMNVLYDRDHFKIALGQVNAVRNIIVSISKDYIKLLKFSESLYQCKQLKRAALGRMMTAIKKLKSAFQYLEQVRQHLGRLPTINPTSRTLILTGYPNVGKSSFMNQVTHADVDVQPYAFTTKSLFVGHLDYQYMRFQVIDTPGILDHPLSERNTIEMQSITALAHLNCCILYFIDISETCGYNIEEQISLFESISPLFANKEIVLILNKTDLVPFEELSDNNLKLLNDFLERHPNLVSYKSSNIVTENIGKIKELCCSKLIHARTRSKKASSKLSHIMNQITITYPKANGEEDNDEEVGVRRRPKPFIPTSVKKAQQREEERRQRRLAAGEHNEEDDGDDDDGDRIVTERDLELANGGTGVYSVDITKNYILKNEDYRLDHIPSIVNGKNIFDYIDPEIERRLEELLREEDALVDEYNERLQNEVEEDPLTQEEKEVHQEIRDEVASIRHTSKMNKNTFKPVQKRSKTLKDFREHLQKRKEMDLPQETINNLQSKSQKRRSRSQRTFEELKRNTYGEDAEMELPTDDTMNEEGAPSRKKLKKLKKSLTRHSRSRSSSHLPQSTPQTRGLRDQNDQLRVERIEEKVRQVEGLSSRSNSGDRKTFPKLHKHLIVGKMGLGTRRWR